MRGATDFQYLPDYAVPPGETLLETLGALGMTQAELAERTGLTPKTVNLIVKGSAPITAFTALQLELVLGTPASFWNNREMQYRESLMRQQQRRRLEGDVAWLRRIPYRAMARLGWVAMRREPVDQVAELLRFFGAASVRQWEILWTQEPLAAFRASTAFARDPGAVAAWLRRGEIVGQQLHTEPYELDRFRSALRDARELTHRPPGGFQEPLVGLCAAAGVAVAFVPELPKTRSSGATRWLTPTKALIQLSLRYKTDDQLWFTFFHEAGHIVLHGKKDFFIEGDESKGDKEDEANRFAADLLLPRPAFSGFVQARRVFSKADIAAFAEGLRIAPGIVVGRLQHDGLLPHTHCNDLKRRLEWG